MLDENSVQSVREALAEYECRYGLWKLKLTEPYHISDQWNEYFPNTVSAGCYFFYDEDGILLYIGKASLKSNSGLRVGSYFRKEEGKPVPKDSWKPVYLQTVAVEHPWEACSLEEYLIERLQPPGNLRGIRKPEAP